MIGREFNSLWPLDSRCSSAVRAFRRNRKVIIRLTIVPENLEKYLSFLFKTCFTERTNHDALRVQAEKARCRQQDNWWNCGVFAIINLFDVALGIEPISKIDPSHI